MKIGKTRLPS